MRHKMQVAWVEKLKALKPRKGSMAHSLLTIGQVTGFFTRHLIDEVWCRIVEPNSRPGMKEGR